ncbi:MAG: hypothetical protein ACOC0G_01275 [Thermodesulfobacteriota bacterium]
MDEETYLLKEQQWERAAEHLQLVQQQGVSSELKKEIDDVVLQLQAAQ